MVFWEFLKAVRLQCLIAAIFILWIGTGCSLGKRSGEYFEPAGFLAEAHGSTKALLLKDGRILITNGSKEIYDPKTQKSQVLPPSLAKPVSYSPAHYSQTLLSSGKVLLLGKFSSKKASGITEQEFSPGADTVEDIWGTWKNRNGHTANLLPDGNVLIWGGGGAKFVQVYNTQNRSLIDKLPLTIERYNHSTASMPNGDILILAGTFFDWEIQHGDHRRSILEVEKYNWSTNKIQVIGKIQLGRENPALVWLNSNELLILGGRTPQNNIVLEIECYNLKTNISKIVGKINSSAFRGNCQPVKLPNGQVLIFGGKSAEIYDPEKQEVYPIKSLLEPRHSHAAIGLPNGDVYILGGIAGNSYVHSVERFNYKEYIKGQH